MMAIVESAQSQWGWVGGVVLGMRNSVGAMEECGQGRP